MASYFRNNSTGDREMTYETAHYISGKPIKNYKVVVK
jgi:hypothetical protein